MSITKPSTLSPEEMDRLFERLENHGARIMMVDPRVTSVQNWMLGTIGVAMLGLAGWGIQSINNLNNTMTRVLTQNEYRDDHVQRIDAHLEAVDNRVVILERKSR